MAPRRPIYLDHQATTPLDPRVLEAMQPYLREDFGNAASRTHVYGWRARAAVDDARERIASQLGARENDIVFTSGATESNNLALIGAVRAAGGLSGGARSERDHIVTVATEHKAVLDPCDFLETQGMRVTRLGVDRCGRVDPEEVARAIDGRTLLVSVMWANNEIGVIQPIAEIGARCRERGAWLHTDAAQAVGKLPLHVDEANVDLLSISFHKLYGPKGVGALYVRSRSPHVRIAPIQFGGGHEGGLRSGTLPVAALVGAAAALDLCAAEGSTEAERQRHLRDRLWQGLSSELSGVVRNGDPEGGLPGNLHVSFEGVDGDRLLAGIEGVAVSAGSACTSEQPAPSHVLQALGIPPERARASLRFGLGRGTTLEEIDEAADRVVEAVRRERGDAVSARSAANQ